MLDIKRVLNHLTKMWHSVHSSKTRQKYSISCTRHIQYHAQSKKDEQTVEWVAQEMNYRCHMLQICTVSIVVVILVEMHETILL